MTDSSQIQNSKSPGEKNESSAPHLISASSADPIATDNKAAVITEKFLAVAKEKNNLESIIMSQNDRIKELEKEKEKLLLSLKKFTASHKDMKEKLLDFDILRNMEISELKKKIEHVMANNKKLISEKNAIVRNLDRDTTNISRVENQVVVSLEKSIEAGELDLEQTRGSLKTTADTIRELERELSAARAQAAESELDRDEARAELYKGRAELEYLKADRVDVEKRLRQKVDEYSKEIAGLKTDIDELTSAMECKIQGIDELNEKVVRLSGELSHKDSELHQQIPALLEKINSLSQSIEMKMEENSLFTKELFDLNVTLSALNEEMIEKEELLLDISEDYKKQKNEIEALHGVHELTLRNIVYERDLLKKENEELRSTAAVSLQQQNTEDKGKKAVEDRLSETLKAIDDLGLQNTGLTALKSEKDAVINDLQREVVLLGSKIEGAAAEYAESLAALQDQLSVMNRQLLEKDEMLNALAAEHLPADGKDQAAAGLQEELLYQSKLEAAAAEHAADRASLREKIIRLNQQLLEKQELLTVMTSEREHDKNDFLYQTDTLRKEITRQEEQMNRLTERGMEQERILAEQTSLREASQKEKAGLEDDLAQAAQRINELVLEQDRLASLSGRKEQALSDAMTEISVLQANAASLRASQAELEKKITEKQEISGLAQAEREVLQKTAREYQDAFEQLKQEIISLNRNLAEKEQAIALLLTEKQGLTGIISELRSKLQAFQRVGQESPTPVFEKTEEPLPARVEEITSHSRRSLAYALLVLLLLGSIGFSFYAFHSGIITLPRQKPQVREEAIKELAYNDMFSLLTKASASDDLKFQATLLTESLVLKSDLPGDKALFDFQQYLYFKVSISAPRQGLDDEIADDPYPMITLIAGAETVKPLAHIHVKDIKTFYRKEKPVSIMFYCAFPRTALTAGDDTFSLSFKNEKDKADTVWDLKSLRAGKFLP